MRALSTRLSLTLSLTLTFTLVAEGALAQSDGGPAACALEDGWQPGPGVAPTTTIAGWQEEAAAHGPVGSVASFVLDGDDLHVTGEALVVTAGDALALVLHDGSAGNDYLFVRDAVVDGQSGTLVVQGTRLTLSALATPMPTSRVNAGSDAAPTVVRALPAGEVAEDLGLTLSEPWADAQSAATSPLRVPLDLSGVTLSGYTRAALVTASGEITLAGPLVVESAGSAYTPVAVGGVSHAALLEGAALTVRADKLALAGDFTAGTLEVAGSALSSVPKMVLVRGGPVVVTPSGASASDVRVTQALDDEAPLLGAGFEVVSSRRYLRVGESDMEYLGVAVRESGFAHDALFGGVEVEGCLTVEGDDAVQVVVEESWPGFVGVMMAAIESSGWAAPIVAVAVVLTLPGVMLLDAFVSFLDDLFCWFGCPSPPPPPKAFPSWLEPGQASTAELVIHGDAPPGDYPTRIRLLGKNFDAVEVDVLVRVGRGAVPDEWRCSIDAYGSFGACDCGCGVVDPDCPADGGADACELTWCEPGPGLGGMADPADPSRCWTPPAEWSCPADAFARADEVCDCGCGVVDPDCPADVTAAQCTRTWCAEGGTGGTLLDGSVTTCHEPPPEWVCGRYSYAAGDGSCDCGCGALDPDCPSDATVDDCDARSCGTDVDPSDLGRCLPPVEPGPSGDGGVVDDDDDDDAPPSCASAAAGTGAPTGLVAILLLLALVALSGRHREARASYSRRR